MPTQHTGLQPPAVPLKKGIAGGISLENGMEDRNRTLVLSRRNDESLVINVDGKEIIITTFGIAKNKVKLAIQAAKEIQIFRSELIREE